MIITGKYPNLRMRRSRKNSWSRRLVQENSLSYNDLILPIFLTDGSNQKIPIKSMPNIYRYSIDRLTEISETADNLGINLIALFPYTPDEKKTDSAEESINSKNLVCRALNKIKQQNNNFGVMCDIALDPYTSHGHDGLMNNEGEILNDETNSLLAKQALLFAEHGADIIAPSDMMDGRIGIIRNSLEGNKFHNTIILSYAAKFASKMYSPFREAVGSSSNLKSDKKTYQMNIANSNEALREVEMDIKEGADIVMVKPGISYLDIISKIKSEFNFPTFAYQVSGEYSMIKAAANKEYINEDEIVFEQLTSFKRAGADAILTYFAPQVANKLRSGS